MSLNYDFKEVKIYMLIKETNICKIENKTKEILYNLGFKPNIKGFGFIVSAIGYFDQYGDMITKGLYPAIAEEFDTEPTRVERAIRHSIQISFYKNKNEWNNYHFTKKPTNSEFIATIADYVNR